MKFRQTITCHCTIKKQKSYVMDITDKERKEGMKRTSENPLLLNKNFYIYAIFNHKNKLNVNIYMSYYGFVEGPGEHKLHQSVNDWTTCKCGELFRSTKTISAKERLNKHIEQIKKEFSE